MIMRIVSTPEERKKFINETIAGIVRFARTQKRPEKTIAGIIMDASANIAGDHLHERRDIFSGEVAKIKGVGKAKHAAIMKAFDDAISAEIVYRD